MQRRAIQEIRAIQDAPKLIATPHPRVVKQPSEASEKQHSVVGKIINIKVKKHKHSQRGKSKSQKLMPQEVFDKNQGSKEGENSETSSHTPSQDSNK